MPTISNDQNTTNPRTVQFQANTQNLFFHILTACNLRCLHCYINPDQHGTETLSLPTIHAWLELFARRFSDVTQANVIFLGGEPTLHPELGAAIKKAKTLGFRSVTVDSNGFLFNDILEKTSPTELDFLSFSLDGSAPAVNDPIRGDGVFDSCVNGIKRAVLKGFNVSVIFTASSLNIHDLKNMPALLNSLGVRRFFIQVIGIRGRSAHQQDNIVAKPACHSLQLEREQWEDVVLCAALDASKLGISVTYPKVFLDAAEHFSCAGNVAQNYFVFPNGRVYRCPLCEDYPIHSIEIIGDELQERAPLTERELFSLNIPEGCVFNKLLHPGNITYLSDGRPASPIACCMLKQELDACVKKMA